MTKNVTFCFDFGSPYSYLAYNNLNSIREAGGEVAIMPVLLGGIFKATGNQPPATVQKKGEYMFKDINRWSKKLGIPFKMNPYFPILTVPHMRGAVLAQRENITYKVYDLKGSCFVLRFHRKNYSDYDEIKSEFFHSDGIFWYSRR